MRALKKAVNICDSAITTVFRLFFILLLLLGSYFSYDLYNIYNSTSNDKLQKFRPSADSENYAADMKELSEDCVAWLTIDGTKIDFPIMQGEDNMEYLNKDPYGDYSLAGSIFLDTRNAQDFSDSYSLVYGHHMEQGAMFGALDYFKDKNYFDTHRHGTLTVGNTKYALTLFAFVETTANDDAIFDPENGGGPLPSIRVHASIQYNVRENARIVALSTCKTPRSMKRTVVFGYIEAI